MKEIKYYRVHVGYISSNGEVIKPGVYDASVIDIAEASRRSYITPEIDTQYTETENSPDSVSNIKIELATNSSPNDIKVINLDAETAISKPKEIAINTTDIESIIELKFVGKKTAEKVINLRTVEPFESYDDLNKRVPLSANRKWESVAYIVFDFPHTMRMEKGEKFEITNTASNVSK